MSEIDWYILFENHSEGLEMFSYLKGLKLPVRISPTPRALSVCCGMSILIDGKDIDDVRPAIENSGIKYMGLESLKRQIDPTRDKYC
ncbi:MAG: DUF3343 domain-containing protein [Tissierellia bacterium]|nr:DUF3343 domain-containing protein [Tissierellia bacterium]